MDSTVVTEKITKIVTPQLSEALQILDKVNLFYTDSFSHLLYTMSGIIAFIGILVPLAFAFYQNNKLKLEKESLEQYVQGIKLELQSTTLELIQTRFKKEKEIIDASLRQNGEEINKALENNKTDIEEQINSAKGASFFLQGNNEYNDKCYDDALESYITAIEHLLPAKDEANLQRMLDAITDLILPNVNKDILKIYPKIQGRIDSITEDLSSLNENGRYSDMINKLEIETNKTFERSSKKLEAT